MPEISLVMGGSNDNYGGEIYREVEHTPPTSFKRRVMQCMLTIPYAFQDIDYEVVFVVWNEDRNKESLLDWDILKNPRIRLIEVPSAVAKDAEPERQFHETWAKNVGIRRTMSDMIICTNPDVMWLDKFPRELLSIDKVMVSHRWTVDIGILDIKPTIENMIEYCKNPAHIRNPDWNSNGDFTMMPRKLWYELKGLPTPPQRAMAGVDMWQVQRAEVLTAHERRFYPHSIWHIEHPGRPLESSFGVTHIDDDWGYIKYAFHEYCNGDRVC